VQAQDRSFTAKIPYGWKLTGAFIRYFQADSPQGDKVYSAAIDVPSDQQSLQAYVQVMQARGVRFTQQDMQILSQLVSPMLSPEDIVQQLFPRLSLGTVQTVTILESQDLPAGVVQALGNVQSKVVHFRYTQVRSDEGHAGPMEGEVLVTTIPGIDTGVLHYWTFMIAGGDGPQQTFDHNKALYVAILSTLRFDSQALAQNQLPPISNDWIRKQLQIPFNNMWYNNPEYWRDMQGFIASLGAQYYYRDPKDPGNDGYINKEDIPDSRSVWWMCPVPGYVRNIPVPSNGPKPDNLCYPMDPPSYTGNR
jgi:hypothetical protein